MIDLDATGPAYRGHKLSRIVNEFDNGYLDGLLSPKFEHLMQWSLAKPVSTRAWARLDVRVIGNVWGLPVSELDRSRDWEDESGRWHFDQNFDENP